MKLICWWYRTKEIENETYRRISDIKRLNWKKIRTGMKSNNKLWKNLPKNRKSMLLRARYSCHCDSESDLWMNEFQRTCIRAHSHKQSQICSWYAESHSVELILFLSLSYSSDTQTHPYRICIQKSHSTQRLRIHTKKYTTLTQHSAYGTTHSPPLFYVPGDISLLLLSLPTSSLSSLSDAFTQTFRNTCVRIHPKIITSSFITIIVCEKKDRKKKKKLEDRIHSIFLYLLGALFVNLVVGYFSAHWFVICPAHHNCVLSKYFCFNRQMQLFSFI